MVMALSSFIMAVNGADILKPKKELTLFLHHPLERYCHGRAAGRTRETRGKRNNGNLMTEHRIHNHIDELTDKDSGKTQGL